ncbi:MAG: short-chain dehydrogenase [Gammaproteobacteria bacterium TMED36]|nr:MAG: short-chain dehydrogenase [Gammaproteobacteria bacterium TMED36]|tara:strand:+ start:2108 stop:2752 length:645 start_codon:yes stop_codon:yes gene_type:complete
MKAIVLAGSNGIGKGISDELNLICDEVISTSSKDLDTSNIKQVKEFVSKEKQTDVLVLNTGGPPAKDFYDITEDEWFKYYNQLFYSFIYILQNLNINDSGYIFLISSHQIKEPKETMSLSVAYRIAFSSVLKLLTKKYGNRQISCINIAPGPIGTDRLLSLVGDIKELESRLPMGRVGNVKEIGLFIKSIIENNIKYLTGVTINFDGGHSSYVL